MKIKMLQTTIVARKRVLAGSMINVESEAEANYLISLKKAREAEDDDKHNPQEVFADGKDQTPGKGKVGASA